MTGYSFGDVVLVPFPFTDQMAQKKRDAGVGYMKMIHTEVPEQLYKRPIALVEEGWYRDEKEVFSEAIRRFLEAHQPDLMERFLREDVEWGLHGNE